MMFWEKMSLAQSWIFRCVAVAVATDSAANKTWIFKVFTYGIIIIFFFLFLLKIQKVVVI